MRRKCGLWYLRSWVCPLFRRVTLDPPSPTAEGVGCHPSEDAIRAGGRKKRGRKRPSASVFCLHAGCARSVRLRGGCRRRMKSNRKYHPRCIPACFRSVVDSRLLFVLGSAPNPERQTWCAAARRHEQQVSLFRHSCPHLSMVQGGDRANLSSRECRLCPPCT